MKRLLHVILIGLLCVMGLFSNPVKAHAADLSANVTLEGFTITNEGGAISSANPLWASRMFTVEMNLRIDLPSGTFNNGDVAIFDYLDISGTPTYRVNTTAPSPVYGVIGGSTIEIGTWRIVAGTPNKVEITFNSAVTGYNSITNIVLNTGPINTTNINTVNTSGEFTVTLGSGTQAISENYYFKSSSLTKALGFDVRKGSSQPTNTSINWNIYVNNIASMFLMEGVPSSYVFPTDVYLEDNLKDGTLTNVAFSVPMYIPTNLTTPEKSGASYNITVTYFVERFPDYSGAHPTYNDFKNDLNIYEWGIYNDGTDNLFVVNFGDLDSSAIKLSTVAPTFATRATNNAIVTRGAYPEADRTALEAYFESIYGNSNATSGGIFNYLVILSVEYSPVFMDEVLSNTAVLSKSTGTATHDATGTLIGLLGSGSAAKYEGLLLKTDINGIPLSGAIIELQYWDGATWQVHDTKTTGSTGTVSFTNLLPIGETTRRYRFVEVTAAPGYDSSSIRFYDSAMNLLSNGEFIVRDTDAEGHIRVATNNELSKYTVTYDANGGTGSQSDTSSPYYDGTEVTVLGPGTIQRANYDFVGWAQTSGATTATEVAGDKFNITSNTTFYAVWQEKAKTPSTPSTGVGNDVMTWIGLMGISASAVTFLTKKRSLKKIQKNENSILLNKY